MYSVRQNYYSCDCRNKKCLEKEVKMGFGKSRKDLNCNQNDIVEDKVQEREEILAIKSRFPTKVPIIIKKLPWDKNLPILDKCKFLVPQDITMSQFHMIIRNRMQIHPNQAMYLLVNERSMISLSMTVLEVYKQYAHQDGYLYMIYASQETFGSASDSTEKNDS